MGQSKSILCRASACVSARCFLVNSFDRVKSPSPITDEMPGSLAGIALLCLLICVQLGTGQAKCKCVPIYDCPATVDLPSNAPLPSWATSGNCAKGEVCCEERSLAKDIPSCGINFDVGYRIFNHPEVTEIFEFPWLVSILQKTHIDGFPVNLYTCGGSLIHPQVVITTAHKIYRVNITTLRVRAGDWDTDKENEPLAHQDKKVKAVFVHEDFDKTYHAQNIALLLLEEPYTLTDNINIVCLPAPNQVVVRDDCVAAGWGQNSSDSGVNHRVLRKVDLPILPKDECNSRIRKEVPGFFLHESLICAGGVEGKDTCTGDGGSPLMCPMEADKDAYQLLGMVSWGISCGKSIPAGYVNVAHLRSWIDRQMSLLGFTTSYDYKRN